jgi:ribonuclease HI
MTAKAPHFVLFSESKAVSPPCDAGRGGCDESARYWHFVLRTEEGSVALDVQDEEADASGERLALLAVVRGLEALPEPSRVTLVTTSGWIRRGLRFGLDSWRDHQWQWERFGKMAPIKNADLWQRVDRALRYHEVDCRTIRFDQPSDDLSRPIPRSLYARQPDVPPPVTAAQPREAPPCDFALRSQAGNLLQGILHRLFGWCGLCRTRASLVIAAH